MEERVMKVVKKFVREREEFFRNAERNLEELAKRVRCLLPDAEIFVFGSYARGDHDPYFSDIDVLVVSERVRGMPAIERARITAGLREGPNYIFQIHLVSPEEFEIYRKFVDVLREL